MTEDRVVYSTESGSLAKAMRSEKKGQRRPPKRRPPAAPAKGGVRIHRESKGRGGKCVTLVVGLPLQETELKAMLKRLKSQLGTGGSVKQGCLEIQGDKRQRLLEILTKEGYSPKLAGG